MKIITGYIGPNKVIELLEEMPNTTFEICVGMYQNIPLSLYNSLKWIQSNYKNRVKFYFSNDRVHIKTYVSYGENDRITRVLNGSANLSVNAFSLQKEALSTLDLKDEVVKTILRVFDSLFKKTTPLEEMKINNRVQETFVKDKINDILEENGVISWSILTAKKGSQNILGISAGIGELGTSSGLNWGFSNGQPNLRDAYFKLPSSLLRKHKDFFKTRVNNTFDMIFPDGTSFEMLMEGKQKIKGIQGQFPKQISGYKNKKKLGQYIRQKIFEVTKKDVRIPDFNGNSVSEKDWLKNKASEEEKKYYRNKIITKTDFEKTFGGTRINLKLIGEEVYEVFFTKEIKK